MKRLICAMAVAVASSANAATFTVTTTADAGAGSLRQAIEDANLNPGPDLIQFAILPAGAVHVIALVNPLPFITDTVTIDGLTQPGTTPNSLPEGFNARNLVTVSGAGILTTPPPNPDPTLTVWHGFDVRADDVTLRGLRITDFVVGGDEFTMRSAIFLRQVQRTIIESCVLGLNEEYSIEEHNYAGISAVNVKDTRIGGPHPAQRNLIASNPGWQMRFLRSQDCVFEGNFVGLPASLPAALIAQGPGLILEGGRGHQVGGAAPGQRNCIGNVGANVLHTMRGGILCLASTENRILGNWFGLQPAQTFISTPGGPVFAGLGIAPVREGIWLHESPENRIGGPAPGQSNIFAAHDTAILLEGAATRQNTIQGNLIGTHPDGTAAGTIALGASNGTGIHLRNGANDNEIGGTATAAEGNLISHNATQAILIEGTGTSKNRFRRNLIGSNLAGTHALPNGTAGNRAIHIRAAATENEIGGIAPDATNLISGNIGHGILLEDAGTTANLIQGNLIGPDITGTSRLPYQPPLFPEIGNTGSGIHLAAGAHQNLIGGPGPLGNLISANGSCGITLENDGSGTDLKNSIQGNIIGLSRTGAALPNEGGGILASSDGNLIGGTLPDGAPNTISSNGLHGLHLAGARNRARYNRIGTTPDGLTARPNAQAGVRITGTSNELGAATFADGGNLISGNTGPGILIDSATATLNTVSGNRIGTDTTGNTALGNGTHGIHLTADASENTIGPANLISANSTHGILIETTPTIGTPTRLNTVTTNLIGLNAPGDAPLGNTGAGIAIHGSAQNTLRQNTISANATGILISLAATGTILHGNHIGTGPAGTGTFGNSGHGIHIENGTSTEIGGTSPGHGNTIAHNTGDGIHIAGGTGHLIRGNAISENAQLGINLRPASEPPGETTPNDPLDNDSGPNQLQNFPEITRITWKCGETLIHGRLDSTPLTAFTIELFRNTTADPSGHGEGAEPLGTLSVTTDAAGTALWTFALPGYTPGAWFTATASSPDGTSEFSTAAQLTLESFATWAAASIPDPGQRGPLDDPDGDAIPNVTEYATGLDPMENTLNIHIVHTIETGHLTVTVCKNPGAIQAAITAQSTGTLPGFSSAEITVLQNNDTTYKARDNFPIGTATSRFLHIQIELIPLGG